MSLKIIIITQGISRIIEPLLKSNHQIIGVLDNLPRDNSTNVNNSIIIKLTRYIIKVLRKTITLESECSKRNIPYRKMINSNDNGLETWIRNLNPDLIVVYSMSSLLTRNIFSIPKFGTINLHPSYLPDYRGPNPCFWQYYDLELNPGVTVHYINDGEDDGDIIYQSRVNIQLGVKSSQRLDLLINQVGVNLLLNALNNIENCNAPRIPQQLYSKTKRARNVKKTEHLNIIKWNEWSGEKIWHILRGTEDWLNAFSQPDGIYSGTRWIIEDFISGKPKNVIPGNIYKSNKNFMLATKDGYIRIRRKINLFNLFKIILRFEYK